MIRKTLGWTVFGAGTLFITVGFIACSDDGPTAKYPSSDAFCAAKATEECKDVGQICGVTADACKSKRTDVCKAAASAATAQGRTFNSGNADVCVQKTTDVYKDRITDAAKEKAFKEACEHAFVGAKKKTEGCSTLYECEGTLTCDLEKESVCADKVDKAAGEFCNNPGETCATGFYCQDKNGTKSCGGRKKVDEACDPKNPCLEDLRCTTKCVPKETAGQPCDTDDECTTRLCDLTSTPRKCIARQYPSETGTCKDFGGS